MSEINLKQVIDRFDQSQYCWVSTVRPDGRSHATPIWHVWHQGRIYLVTKESSVKVANIRVNANVAVTHPDPSHAIIFEGQARTIEGKTELLQPFFKEKYDWDIVTDEEYKSVIEITPSKLMAWGDEGAGKRKRWQRSQIAAAAGASD